MGNKTLDFLCPERLQGADQWSLIEQVILKRFDLALESAESFKVDCTRPADHLEICESGSPSKAKTQLGWNRPDLLSPELDI